MPARLLMYVIRRMTPELGEWGKAMLSELCVLEGSLQRWEFAMGCAWVAFFPPGKGGRMRTIKSNLITAALGSTLLVAPLIYLELHHAAKNYASFPYVLFAVLWLAPAAFLLTAASMLRAMRGGENVLARPAVFAISLAFLVLAAFFWAGLVNDQMPCFLGVPNCD
jgi:hypothetical protein